MKKLMNSILLHNKPAFRFIIYSYGIAVLLLIFLLIVHLLYDIPYSHLTRDPVVELEGDPFTGILSNLGIIFWSGTAAICLFVALYSVDDKSKKREQSFFLTSFIVTAILLLDDLFLFHDIILPDYFKIRERYIFLTYLIITAAYIYFNRKIMLRTPYLALIIAGCFFSLSILVDIAFKYIYIPAGFLIEDGSKFMGIISWGSYLTFTGFICMKNKLPDK